MSWGQFYQQWMVPFNQYLPVKFFLPLLGVLIIWSLIWKGLALWRAARTGDTWWYVILLVVNTLGILEIIYLYAIRKEGGGDGSGSPF